MVKLISEDMNLPYILVVLAILISGEATSSHGCYFPYEMQHSYNENVITVSQQNTWRQHKINPINITADSISMLGDCYRYLANNHLLIVLLNGTTKQLCYRCIYLKLVTRYIVKINLETQVSDDIKRLYLTRCYSNEIEAMRNCPDTDGTTLYIFKSPDRIDSEICPAHLYRQWHTNAANQNELFNMNTNQLNLNQHCNENVDFKCLGTVKHTNANEIMFLYQKSMIRLIEYGVKENELTMNSFTVKPSSSSNLELEPINLHLFGMKLNETRNCKFGDELNGMWNQMWSNNDFFVMDDEIGGHNLRQWECVKKKKFNNGNLASSTYLITSIDCNNQLIERCLTVKKHLNLLEVAFSESNSQQIDECMTADYSSRWQTKVLADAKAIECPINGTFYGVLPDADNQLCAKLASDCYLPGQMLYQIYSCSNSNEIYEERIYECLGEIKHENYAFVLTKRKNLMLTEGTDRIYECFMGMELNSRTIYIKESGESCNRTLKPLEDGMKMEQIGIKASPL